ncbi:MAG: DUF3109 family protein [Bacteroidales bacterium]|jgi:hypothetical protein|nr:DUF3109 family protein [Bacteroidales bacterium]
MIQIENTLVSLDVIEKQFCCDIARCKGICCIEGDSGAPLTDAEVLAYQTYLPKILPFLCEENQHALRSHNVFYYDHDGEKVTTLINNAQCAFTVLEDGVFSCAIERAYKTGVIPVQKPISCHLYPIRCRQYRDFEAVNYETWAICGDAVCKGKKEHVRVYEFLKEPLIRKYGKSWYAELEKIAKEWLAQKQGK